MLAFTQADSHQMQYHLLYRCVYMDIFSIGMGIHQDNCVELFLKPPKETDNGAGVYTEKQRGSDGVGVGWGGGNEYEFYYWIVCNELTEGSI